MQIIAYLLLTLLSTSILATDNGLLHATLSSTLQAQNQSFSQPSLPPQSSPPPSSSNPFWEQIKAIQHHDADQRITPSNRSAPSASIANTRTTEPQATLTSASPADTPPTQLWNLRNADIRAVIEQVAQATGKNFLIDPRVQGKISIISSTPISEQALYQVFLSMLQISGYSAIPSGRIIKIVPNMEARTLSSDLLNQLKNPPHGDDVMVRVIPVHYVPSDQLVPILRPLMPQWSSVSSYGPSNMLILSGRASNINQMAEIIHKVDISSINEIDIVPLHHTLAMDIANTLKELVKTQPGYGVHSQTMLAADDRSNAILLRGNKTERLKLRLLIAQLDRHSSSGVSNNTKVIYLNYLRAEDLAPILAGVAQANFSGNVGVTIGTISKPPVDSSNPESLLANGPSTGGPSKSPIIGAFSQPAATPTTTTTSTQSETGTKPNVQIIAEPNTNSIIINAPPTLIRTLRSVISQLDIKPAQLLIEAIITEINERDFNNLGIEWGSINQTTKDPDSFRPGFAVLNSKTSINQFQAQIYALVQQHKANILSTPSVVVLDNHQAKILIGQQVSVATSSYPNNAQGTTTASPFTTYDRLNVALHLYVRPQITQNGGIEMQIDQGNNTIDPGSESNTTNPKFNISAIVTSVHVHTGDALILGGLAQNSLADDNTGLPILKDIPGIGRLFQRNSTTRDKKILMVFIRPHVLNNDHDNLQVTSSKYNHLRSEQLDFLREQETYDPRDKDQLIPPWNQAKLPQPFCKPPCRPSSLMTK